MQLHTETYLETLYKKLDEPFGYTLSNDNFDFSQVTREDIKAVPGAFYLRNVLNEEECNSILSHMFPERKNYEKFHKNFPVLFRSWDSDPEAAYRKLGVRIFMKSEQVADALYERTKNVLEKTFVTTSPKDGTKTNWVTKSLHPRIRFVCYRKGQNFPPHFDDPYILNETVRSHFTFVIYLSKCGNNKADFGGGEFAFLSRKKEGTEMVYSDLAVIPPEPGLVVVFPHQTLHESKPLTNGYKFMIRSDVMYQKVVEANAPVDSDGIPAPKADTEKSEISTSSITDVVDD